MNGLMRPSHNHSHNQNMRRRGRGNHRKPQHGGSGGGRNQSHDSNGPGVRLRGTAHQIYEKYLALGRDAASSGDRIVAESFFQHADHYYRIILASSGPPDQQGERTFEQAEGDGGANGYSQHGESMLGDPSQDSAPFGAPQPNPLPAPHQSHQGSSSSGEGQSHSGGNQGYRQNRDRFPRYRGPNRGPDRGQQQGGDGREQSRDNDRQQNQQRQDQNRHSRPTDDERFEPPAFLRVDRPADNSRDDKDDEQN